MKIKFRVERPTPAGPEIAEVEIDVDARKTVAEVSELCQSLLLDVLMIQEKTAPPKQGLIKGLLDWGNRKQ